MIRLDNTVRKLQIVLTAAKTTNDIPVMVSYSDKTSTAYTGGTQLSNTNGITAVDICAAPAASTVRDVDYIQVYNKDTAAKTVQISLINNVTAYQLIDVTLQVDDKLEYTHGSGWKVTDINGNVKTIQYGAELTTNKDASNGYVGLTLMKHNFWNAARTFLSFFTNTNTAARTYAFPDKDLTMVGTADTKHAQDFRLTLTSGVAVTAADVTAAPTVYLTPYKGNSIALYNGTTWDILQSAEVSIALGTLTASLPYDIFAYNNAGTVILELLAWTNTTTRTTALAYQDGVLVKSGTTTRRYLGTFFTTSTTTTEDSAAKRYLWNYYNRVNKSMQRVESTASWTYTTATLREANGSTANRLQFVIGVAEDMVTANLSVAASNTLAATAFWVGLGYDSTTADTAPSRCVIQEPAANYAVNLQSTLSITPAAGYHWVSWLEYSAAAGTTTWIGSSVYGLSGGLLC